MFKVIYSTNMMNIFLMLEFIIGAILILDETRGILRARQDMLTFPKHPIPASLLELDSCISSFVCVCINIAISRASASST